MWLVCCLNATQWFGYMNSREAKYCVFTTNGCIFILVIDNAMDMVRHNNKCKAYYTESQKNIYSQHNMKYKKI